MTRQRSLTYKVWHAMRGRCTNPAYENYPRYGGRGIRVCARWESFDAFVEDMGLQPPGLLLDRLNNNGNYEPGNCRWVTSAESNRNYGRNRVFEARGKSQCLADWAAELGMSQQTLWARLQKGWAFDDAISVPILRRSRFTELRIAA